MDNERSGEIEAEEKTEETDARESSPRARNRTVMLTPEITGEVRARLAHDFHGGPPNPAPVMGLEGQHGGSGVGAPNTGMVGHGEGRNRRVAAGSKPAPQTAAVPPVQERRDRDHVIWSKDSPLVGFLISYDKNKNGDVFELRTGRLIVTADAAGIGDFLVLRDDSVSPMHAILRMSVDGEIQVLDQLSEYGTIIKRISGGEEERLSGDKGFVGHGDVIKFGKRKFYVCLVPKWDDNQGE